MELPSPNRSSWRDTHDPNTQHGTTVPTNEELRLRLSDQDLHLIDFPHGPPTTSGGFCELYIAIYKPQNIKLAMKRLRFDFPTEDMSRRFLREAEIWATFQHPNILPFFGTMTINYRFYLVSPWMALGDLLEFVQARAKYGQQGNGQFDESVPPVYSRFDEVTVVREMAAGLAYLHSHGAIHGDMKAKNVLLNGAGCAQICDFGLTKTLDHAATSEALKGVGSIRWQSPELLSNAPKSPKSDVYALGMTIAEVLTGNYPFPHLKDNNAVLFALMIDHERPTFDPLSRLGVDFEPLWKLAAKCWQMKAEDRPSMDEVFKELQMMGSRSNTFTTENPTSVSPDDNTKSDPDGGVDRNVYPQTRSPYKGTTRGLVVAIDFGTTQSGVAYATLEPGEVPRIRSVTNYPGQEHQGSKPKVPSVLYYDHQGNVRARGAEINNPDIADDALDLGWIAVEWLKLLFRPPEQQHIEVPPVTLPPGKSSVDVLADFLEYLQQAAREYISSHHMDGRGDIWNNLESKIIYVLSHPNGWDGSQQAQLRRASEIAGLIPSNDAGRVQFVSECEAALHWCLDSDLGFRADDNIIVADVGGGTIDVSSFTVTSSNPFQIAETRPPECSLTGSVSVNNAFNKYVIDRLEGTAYDQPEVYETLAREFEAKTKPRFRNSARPSYIPLGFRPANRDPTPSPDIRANQLILPGEVMRSFFEPSCQGLVDAITAQLMPSCNTIIFLVGGFAASPWLYSELQTRLKNHNVTVRQEDDHYVRTVAEGAVGFYLDPYVAARFAKLTYGIHPLPTYDPENPEHTAREHLVRTTAAGRKVVAGGFSAYLARGTLVEETSVCRIMFQDDAPVPAPYRCIDTLFCYRGKIPNIKWVDNDPNNFGDFCHITATLPPTCFQRRTINGKPRFQIQYWAVLTFGTVELTCYIEWTEAGVTRRGPATLVWDEC